MSWFQVDDGFYSHPKVLGIPRGVRAEAIGTWLLAGAWSADKLRDGHVPAYMIDELGGTEAGAAALVEARLWIKRRDGYQFKNWAKYQLTREKVEERRESEKKRKADYRARKTGNTGESHGNVPWDNGGRPNTLSNPRPTPPNPMTDDHSEGNLTSEQPGTGSTVNNSVETVDNDLARIVGHITKLTGRDVHPLEAQAIREHYLDRASAPPRMPTRFVLACLTKEDPLVLSNYLNTGRWSE